MCGRCCGRALLGGRLVSGQADTAAAGGQPLLDKGGDELAVAFPELKLIGAHTGYPWERELVAVA